MKLTIVSIIISVGLIGGAIVLSRGALVPNGNIVPENNVSIVNGKQIIQIQARGGYQPRRSTAKAGLPTILRFSTSGTFDCSSFVRIPSLGMSKSLPQTGSTDIDIGVNQVGVLQGMCGMGMYPFEINFQ
ncbi:MAG TPA: cupredoxin domain-containing protein [Candidatus Paceibacterota bacterium]